MCEAKLEHEWTMNAMLQSLIYNMHRSGDADFLDADYFNPMRSQDSHGKSFVIELNDSNRDSIRKAFNESYRH